MISLLSLLLAIWKSEGKNHSFGSFFPNRFKTWRPRSLTDSSFTDNSRFFIMPFLDVSGRSVCRPSLISCTCLRSFFHNPVKARQSFCSARALPARAAFSLPLPGLAARLHPSSLFPVASACRAHQHSAFPSNSTRFSSLESQGCDVVCVVVFLPSHASTLSFVSEFCPHSKSPSWSYYLHLT
jgi:hypothetical protein